MNLAILIDFELKQQINYSLLLDFHLNPFMPPIILINLMSDFALTDSVLHLITY